MSARYRVEATLLRAFLRYGRSRSRPCRAHRDGSTGSAELFIPPSIRPETDSTHPPDMRADRGFRVERSIDLPPKQRARAVPQPCPRLGGWEFVANRVDRGGVDSIRAVAIAG